MHAHVRSIAGSILAASLASCGQSADVIGGRNEVPPPPEDTGWETDFVACATERVEAALVPTTLLLAVDRSGSMADPSDPYDTSTDPPTKWEVATSAFTAFFRDPESSTIGAALRLWPTEDGCDNVACDAVVCSVPTVPLGSLGDVAHQDALIAAFGAGTNTATTGGTPMHAALDGAVRWAADRTVQAPNEAVAIVFVTDGQPNGCDEDLANIAGLAGTSAGDGVPVYVVGIEGVNVDTIAQIATAGGTGLGYFVGSANAEDDLLDALLDIQAQVVSCRYTFPDESTGDPLSPDLVRVEYTDDGGEIVSVRRVLDAGACGTDGGWYLDDPEDPSTITLCAGTCDEVQGIETVAIEIDVGCECVTDEDCEGDDVCSAEGCVPPCEGPGCDLFAGESVPITGRVAVQGGAWRCDGTGGAPLAGLVLALAVVRRRRKEP